MEFIRWGRSGQTTGSYEISSDDYRVINDPYEKFDLVTFTHNNRPSDPDRLLKSVDFELSFDVSINNVNTNITKDIKINHLETYNRVPSDNPNVTSADFIFFDLDDQTYLLDGKRYRLEVTETSGDTVTDSQGYVEELRSSLNYYENNSGYNNTQLNNHIRDAIELYDNSKVAVTPDSQFVDANNDNFIDGIERGEFVFLKSGENAQNSFDLQAQLVLLDAPPEIENNLEDTGSLNVGADGNKAVEWTTEDSDVSNRNVS